METQPEILKPEEQSQTKRTIGMSLVNDYDSQWRNQQVHVMRVLGSILSQVASWYE